MNEILPDQIFCDGGVIGPNPSSHGGTFAFCWVDSISQRKLKSACGIIKPEHVKPWGGPVLLKITNNFSEAYAAVQALLSLPFGWNGVLFTDSLVTLYRLTTSDRFNGIPDWLRKQIIELRQGRRWQVELVSGHPTQIDLRRGCTKHGRLVSPWNVWCDKTCSRLAKEFLRKHEGHT